MTFTIVLPTAPPDEFVAESLDMAHKECGGGAIELEVQDSQWVLRCRRCTSWKTVIATEEGTAAICQTAIDGQPRTPKIGFYGGTGENRVVVVRNCTT